MESLGINFSEIFLKKHGKRTFQDIKKQITLESKSDCDKKYIDIVFAVAFLTYLEVDNKNKIYILGDIPKSIDIENLKNIHKKSILKIQKYINMASKMI